MSPGKNIHLMIVSENRIHRESLALALMEHSDLTAECVTSFQVAAQEINSSKPNVVLIDIDLCVEALQLAAQIKCDSPEVKVVMLGLVEVETTILECIEAGADAFILKESSLNDLIDVIGTVHRGETYCSPKIAYTVFTRVAELARQQRGKQVFESSELSVREIEILQLIAEGMGNKEIAQRLYLSLHTVKNHVHNILERLRVGDRAEAVRYAKLKGLLTTEKHENRIH